MCLPETYGVTPLLFKQNWQDIKNHGVQYQSNGYTKKHKQLGWAEGAETIVILFSKPAHKLMQYRRLDSTAYSGTLLDKISLTKLCT